MPRSEARVFTSIWKDPHFRALPWGAQRLYMFLLSQEELTYCGVLPLRERRWAGMAAGLTVDQIRQDLELLEGSPYPSPYPSGGMASTPFVLTDAETEEAMVRALLRRDQAWKQPNLLKQAREQGEQIESRRIRGALLAELRRLPLEETGSEQVRTLVAEWISDLEQGSPYPSPYPSGNPPGYPSGDASAKDHARAREYGERNGSSETVPPNSLAPVPSSLPAHPPKTDRKTGTRLPADFALTADMRAWAKDHAQHVDPDREFERFRDYWESKAGRDGRKVDWLATWRNWMRTAEDRQAPRHRTVDRRQQATDELFGDAMERARLKDAQEGQR